MTVNKLKIEHLEVIVLKDRQALGQEAAGEVSKRIQQLLQKKTYVNIIFAAAPSQNEFLQVLKTDPTINWESVNAFHMDEYVGLKADAPQLFGNFLKTRLFEHVPLHSVHYINGNAQDLNKECERYGALLKKYPPDIVCLGIGENTHIAFNDPYLTDFDDPKMVKKVSLDLASRQQQVNDGCFAALAEVPLSALTLTVPSLFKATYLYCMVPGEAKAIAIKQTLTEPLSEAHPSTILKNHRAATLFVDTESFKNV